MEQEEVKKWPRKSSVCEIQSNGCSFQMWHEFPEPSEKSFEIPRFNMQGYMKAEVNPYINSKFQITHISMEEQQRNIESFKKFCNFYSMNKGQESKDMNTK